MSIKVENMRSATTGHKVATQLIIYTENETYFQSYDNIIVKIENGQTTLDKRFWNYSKTTSKYRDQFLGESKAETQRKIEQGIYKLENLN